MNETIGRKPGIRKIVEIVRMKKRAAKLHEKIDDVVNALCDEFGEGRFDYDLAAVHPIHLAGIDRKEKRYLKFEIVDNVRKMLDGESIWKSVSMKPVSFSAGMLKGRPKSLK